MIWDVRNAAPALILKAHAKEVLWADWCKYNDCVLATASIDKTIKVCQLYGAALHPKVESRYIAFTSVI